MSCRRRFCAYSLPALFLLGVPTIQAQEEPRSFELEAISVFDHSKRHSDLIRGQSAYLLAEPEDGVTGTPEPSSEAPLHGSFRLGQGVYPFLLDESGGTGTGYDTLYLDANGDRDLGDALRLKRLAVAPEGATTQWDQESVCFAKASLTVDPGGDLDPREVEVLAKLRTWDDGDMSLYLVSTMARRAMVVIGGERCELILAQTYRIPGRYDSPSITMILEPEEHWWGADRVSSVRQVKGEFYTFSCDAEGEKFTVHPYTGEVGVFRVGAGGRDLDKLSVSGSLAGTLNVPVGEDDGSGWREAATETRLPVGDYRPNYLTVDFGSLSIDMSSNYHADGSPRERGERPLVNGIEIRAERPYVFDFSNEPEVMFAAPALEQRFKRGESVEVMGVLTDPVLDIMIRGLDRGRESLDPTVRVLNSAGKQVATGLMPFG